MAKQIERAAKGRFAPGNQGGPGRPRKQHEARFQAIVYTAATDESVFRVVSKMIELAEQGDVAAARLVLSWLLASKPDPYEAIP